MKNKIATLSVLIIVYLLLKYLIPYGNYVIYPVNILVTFLHEFGHSFFAIITGGGVTSLEVNSDGSGLAKTYGGIMIFVLMGGYIGSAIFGNILLYIGFKSKKVSQYVLYILSGLMVFVSVFWFSDIVSFILLVLLAGALGGLAYKTNYDQIILQFLGVTSLLFIIEDFNVGPSSDLSKISDIFIIIPQFVWMIVWLIAVLVITGFNLKFIFKK